MYSAQGHPTPETLEEYAFRRLPEADTEALEEHLMACGECQTALADIDEYILLMKVATARPAEVRPAALPVDVRQTSKPWAPIWAYGSGLAVAIGAACVIALWPAPIANSPAQTVLLQAVRGGDAAANYAKAGRPVDLTLDLSGLTAPLEQYRVDIVTASGKVAWTRELIDSQKSIHIAKGLSAGAYWVRLYAGSELMREYGLKAD